MEKNTNFNYKNLSPFKWFVLENFPFIEADFDAITEWQLFNKIGNEINKIIDSQNIVGEQSETLTNAFNNLYNYVNNYFKNIDVQEEINNKLNEMASSGELQNIIGEFLKLNSLLTFNTINELKNSNNLIEGSFAKTLGYYFINDGGSGLYKIIAMDNSILIDNAHYIPLNNQNLVAELIFNEVNLNQWGAKGDGIQDDTSFIQNALDYAFNNKYNITSNSNKTYLISDKLNVKNLNIDLSNSKIKANNRIDTLLYMDIIDNKNFTDWYGELKNIRLDCTNCDYGIKIQMGRKKLINNINFENISNVGLAYLTGYEVTVSDCNFTGNGTSNTTAIQANGGDSLFKNNVIIDCFIGILNRGFNYYKNIHGWMRSHDFTPQSSFFKCGGNTPAIISQCYSDTYGITFNMEDAWIICDQLYVYFNGSIYLENFSPPYLFYNNLNKFNDYYQRQCVLTNSHIQGVSSNKKIIFSNTDTVGIKVNYNNIRNVEGYNSYNRTNYFENKAETNNINRFVVNKFIVKNGFVYLNLVFQINATISKEFLIGDLPSWAIPSNEINTFCSYGNNGNVNASDGVGLLKIYDSKIRGSVNNSSGNEVYVKINLTYPILSEFTGN